MLANALRWRPRLSAAAAAGLSLGVGLALLPPGSGRAAGISRLRAVIYHGYRVEVPRAWPVFNLSLGPRTCVRFDRHALYLGTPARQQSCPAASAGRTEAILLEPSGSRSAAVLPGAWRDGSASTFSVPSSGVFITATWARRRGLIEEALGRTYLPRPRRPRVRIRLRHGRVSARISSASPNVYTGPGFDACSAPSSQTMSAWSSSRYRAIGIYIGGVNAACAQPNLTPDWVSQQIAAGWHLVPTYVGLQAPTNSCGCAGMSPSQASAQGTNAANNAVADMQALGLPAGNPIYFDMEAYSRTSTNSGSVLAFLGAWTTQLHADGYTSGVYSSLDSGVADLESQWGTSYPEPDDLWFADWNGQQTTSSGSIPAADWSAHHRLHQYEGAHNETHGGATINIDSDYLGGATAGTVAAPAPVPPPTLTVSPASNGTTVLKMSWPEGSGLSRWQVLGGPTPSSLVHLSSTAAHAGSTEVTLDGTDPYFAVQALGSGGQVLASSSTVSTPPHVTIFGRSAFVSAASGVGGVPVGCYTATSCHLGLTVAAGSRTLVRTGSEAVGAGGVGILYFRLPAQTRSTVAHTPGRPLAVTVTARERSGASATAPLNLVGFTTSGRSPQRGASPSAVLRVVGLTAFVSARGTGGVLTACLSPIPCWATAKLTTGRTTLVKTGRELIGANELGYLAFSLSSRGQALLDHAPGNQLGARVVLTSASATASAGLVLTRF